MSDYFDSVKRFASQTYNNVVQASSNAVAQVQQQQIPPIYVNGVMYQVLEKHGEGGFSFVYKVSDSSGRLFALKRILLADKKAGEAAAREVRFLREIPRHRALVELVASEVSAREALLVFEFCDGGSVYSLIERRLEQNRPLREDEVWAIYHAACEAVEHLHTQNPPIIHRDLKVENLLICQRGVVLCDFGSATTHVWDTQSASDRRQAEEDISNNTTMSYRSPEMADLYAGKRITEKSDIWALGVLLYRLAYFEPPWDTDSSLAILNCKYRIPHRKYSDNVPDVIKMLFVMDPVKRPDIYHLLERVLAIRGKSMSATMVQRRDAYRQRQGAQQQHQQQQQRGGGDDRRGNQQSSNNAVKVESGFVAASLFSQLEWQDAGGSQQQQQPQQRQPPSFSSFEQQHPSPAPQRQAPQQQQQQQQPSFFASFDQASPAPQRQPVLQQHQQPTFSPAPQRQQFSSSFEQLSLNSSRPGSAGPQFPATFDNFAAAQTTSTTAPHQSAAFEQAFLQPAQPQRLNHMQPSFSPANSPAVGRNAPLPQQQQQQQQQQQHFAAPVPQRAYPLQQQQQQQYQQTAPARTSTASPSFTSFAGPSTQQPFFANFPAQPQQQQQQYVPSLHAMPNSSQDKPKTLDDLFK